MAGAPNCYLHILDKLRKICRTVILKFAATLEPLNCCRNVASLGLVFMYYFDRCSSELAELVLVIVECPLVILLDCVILSPYGCLCQQFLSSDS